MTERPSPHRSTRSALASAFRRIVEAALDRAEKNAGERTFRRAERDAPALGDVPAAGRPLEQTVDELLGHILPNAMRTDHPRFFAFIPSPASPLSWLGELLTSIHNQHAGADLQSEGASAIERTLIDWLRRRAGMPAGAGGLFVSGGSLANLTALTVARDRMLSDDERPRAVAYVSSQTHSSVAKALRIIGLAERQIRLVAVDDGLRIDAGALAAAVARDRAAGLAPFVVAASAGTTNTGAVDPLEEIADLCAAEKLWMHVDGAFGASALLCRERRGLVAGIERADSLSWDAHKWLFQTYGCGVVLVRNARLLADSFRTGQDYLRDGENGGEEPNFWDLGPELTRPARATKLWLTLQTMGGDAVDAAISHGFGTAETVETTLRGMSGWEIVSPAQMAIVAFRYAPAAISADEADGLNEKVARRMLDSGFAVVGTTRLGGRTVLRMCTINPQTTAADVSDTLERLDGLAREELDALRPARRSGRVMPMTAAPLEIGRESS